MRLDPQKCPPGTVGFIRCVTVHEFGSAEDFEHFKKPTVVLGEDRKWHWIDPVPDEESIGAGEAAKEPTVFSDWREAILFGLQKERADAMAEIEELQKTIDHANNVEHWLYEAK